MHGRSHTRSPGMSIMRVDSRELSLSTIPLCQLLPCHFSINLCQRLSWLHYWSIPHVHTSGAFSPSEWGPDPQCQAGQVAQWTWWWQCLAAWHCRSVQSLPCHSAADAGGLALSMAKSHWHGALQLHICIDKSINFFFLFPFFSDKKFDNSLNSNKIKITICLFMDVLTLSALGTFFSRQHIESFLIFPRKQD